MIEELLKNVNTQKESTEKAIEFYNHVKTYMKNTDYDSALHRHKTDKLYNMAENYALQQMKPNK